MHCVCVCLRGGVFAWVCRMGQTIIDSRGEGRKNDRMMKKWSSWLEKEEKFIISRKTPRLSITLLLQCVCVCSGAVGSPTQQSCLVGEVAEQM